eukprot:gnl/TRDRNA2_/TRDRNA2_176047_c0_seq3.p1 gnl/TRDRNA2_/TRDRNA2_176047_c0~~gnl/TRDRNA2_/TRDRNA2_176047_c0_seq3.p1  ORF type:complete len:250 (+),score=36.87 gnl/TRDRNA2_/TRDRNA2_176047_c0_seq3:83-832(+)
MGSSHSCSLELTQLAARIEKGPVSQDSSPPPIGKKNSSQLPPPLPEWGRHTEDRFDLDDPQATGSLVVVPRSHLHHDKVVSRNHGPRGMDFVRLRNDDPLLRDEAGPKPRLICCRAGDLVIWDSRTVHCNTPALVEDRELQCRAELLRAVAYVCMTPASWAPWAVIRKRRAAAAHGVGTTHWPHEFHPTTAPDLPAPDWAPRASMTPERQKLIDGGFWGFLLLSNSPLLVGVTSLAVLVAALCAAAATS